MIKKIHFIIIIYSLLFLSYHSNAQVLQNMVKNPSFEQYKKVPDDLGQLSKIDYWSSASGASPDFYHKRADSKTVDVPTNKMGQTTARSGYAYAGIYAYASRYIKRHFREYLQVELKKPLIAGNIYCVKVHVYLAESSNRAVGALGCTASAIPYRETHEVYLDQSFEFLLNEDHSDLIERKWVELSCQYKAKGGERYLTIGNFESDQKTKVTGAIPTDAFKNPHVDFAYYFVDDICMTNTRTNFSCDCGSFDYPMTNREERIIMDFKIQKKDYNLGQTVIMKNVKFEKGQAILKQGSQKDIEELMTTLNNFPKYHIEISGHTADLGDPQRNQILSENRAKAVTYYLLGRGIAKERITFKGYGQSRPIALNKTPEGRIQNERIQFKIMKK